MTDQDEKLEQLIKQFQAIEPTSEQSLKWFLAIQQKKNNRRNFYRLSLSFAAGLAIGIIVTGFFLKMGQQQNQEEFSATLAMVSVKNLAGN
ncbi:MAG: hypothetical protein IPJ71_14345 [Bdellovibrionales bacterium]|nr:hypothetical protein [Bdellovibrionales bacterium]